MNAYDTIILGTASAVHQIQRQHLQEIERLKERLGATTLLIGLAKTAMKNGAQAEAGQYLTLAERSARGGDQ